MVKNPRSAVLKITGFSKEGLGRGIWQPQEGLPSPVDVPFAVPGDEVKVNLLKRKGGVYASRNVEWTHFSEKRIEPQCLHFGKCGGCRWQQISYEEQLKQKEAWIARYMQPYLSDSVACHPMIPCLPPGVTAIRWN